MTTAITPNTPDRDEAEAFRHVRKLRGFYFHLMQYVIVIPCLWLINWFTSAHYLWAV